MVSNDNVGGSPNEGGDPSTGITLLSEQRHLLTIWGMSGQRKAADRAGRD